MNDPEAISHYRINHLPSLVYFRKKSHHAYDGDLLDQKKLLSWLTSEDVFELKDEIEGKSTNHISIQDLYYKY